MATKGNMTSRGDQPTVSQTTLNRGASTPSVQYRTQGVRSYSAPKTRKASRGGVRY